MKIGVILGSIRDGRNGEDVAKFVMDVANARTSGHEYELIDLKSFDVPLLTTNTHPMQANKQYEDDRVNAWSKAVDSADAYIFITPEYNHAIPGAFKNAVDSLGAEWVGKPVGFVGYGSVGGVRAIEQWRQAVSNFSMPNARAEVNLNLFFDWNESGFNPLEIREGEVNAVFDAVEELAAQ